MCPNCKSSIALSVAIETIEDLPKVKAARARVDQRVRATENGQSTVQATPEHRCPECGLATRLIDGVKKSSGRPYSGQKCTNLRCGQGRSDRFIKDTFRWGEEVAA